MDQGASILLTWVINFIKWNTGYSKFGEGAKKEQLAQEALSSQGVLNQIDASITNNDEFQSHHEGAKDK